MRASQGNLFKKDPNEVKKDSGLTELCQILNRGYNEKILRLTEVFLPTLKNDKVLSKVKSYNLQEQKEKASGTYEEKRRERRQEEDAYQSRKRDIKNEFKVLQDRADAL